MNGRPLSRQAPTRIDLSGATLEQRAAVFDLLELRGAYFEQDGNVVVVPARWAEDVRGALRDRVPLIGSDQALGPSARLPRPVARRIVPRSAGERGTAAGTVAPLWTRPVRFLVDDFAWSLVAALLFGPAGLSSRAPGVRLGFWLVAGVLAIVVPVALTGRSLGARATGTIVVRVDTLEPPGWGSSLTRWIVPVAPWLVASAVYAVHLGRRIDLVAWGLVLLAEVAIYASVLVGRDRRGLHDVMADTVVVRRRSITPSEPAPPDRR